MWKHITLRSGGASFLGAEDRAIRVDQKTEIMSWTEVSYLINIFTFISSLCSRPESVCISEVTLSPNYVPLVSPLSCVLHWALLQAQNLLACRAFYTLAIYQGLVRERKRKRDRTWKILQYSTNIFWDDDNVVVFWVFFLKTNRLFDSKEGPLLSLHYRQHRSGIYLKRCIFLECLLQLSGGIIAFTHKLHLQK